MLLLDNYSGKDLQMFLSLLNQCEGEGITDLRFIREKLHNYVFNDIAKRKLRGSVGYANTKRAVKNVRKQCPACAGGRLSPVINSEGLEIEGCNICRYSRIVEK